MHAGHHLSPSGGSAGIGSKMTGSELVHGVADWPHHVCMARGSWNGRYADRWAATGVSRMMWSRVTRAERLPPWW